MYDIANQPLAVSPGDGLIYPPDGSTPNLHIYAAACTIIGDWRPKFLEVGTPLVLVTSFKLLDMMLEWVLVQNGTASTFRFARKIAALAGPVVFPPLIESRPWLRERLIALYKELDPLRGTIIHDRHFQATGGTLEVSSSRGGTIGPVVTFSPDDLRNFAVVLVSLLRYLEGTWTMDLFQEKRIRRALDELVHLHRLPSLGQLPPGFLTVRVYVPDEDPIEIDVERIRSYIATYCSGQDILFEVRLLPSQETARVPQHFWLVGTSYGARARVFKRQGAIWLTLQFQYPPTSTPWLRLVIWAFCHLSQPPSHKPNRPKTGPLMRPARHRRGSRPRWADSGLANSSRNQSLTLGLHAGDL